VLVGTKLDLRRDRYYVEDLAKRNQTLITREQGEKLAKKIGAIKYVECSALTKEGLLEVFEVAFKQGIKYQRKPEIRRSIFSWKKIIAMEG